MSMKRAMNLEELARVAGGVEDPIVQQTVTWEDGNGHRFSYTVGGRGQPSDPIVSQSVTWQDGSGHTYTTHAN